MLVVTAEEMREMDRLTIQKYGVSSFVLMERAGEGIADALKRFGRAGKMGVLVVAGKGNNGGDGLVLVRLLKQKHIPCQVVLHAQRDEISPGAPRKYQEFLKGMGPVVGGTE